jgi:hypothetical protein
MTKSSGTILDGDSRPEGARRSEETGIRHLGIQVEDAFELREVYERLQRTPIPAKRCCG